MTVKLQCTAAQTVRHCRCCSKTSCYHPISRQQPHTVASILQFPTHISRPY